ncbi:hypothetical protein, partial [Nocardia wallacei]|uniref:hypothetical protein n=1 Tax=Nocardia wallacei TaxID=480035 RepID=UPI00245760C8
REPARRLARGAVPRAVAGAGLAAWFAAGESARRSVRGVGSRAVLAAWCAAGGVGSRVVGGSTVGVWGWWG